jgi:hypothetical protein
MAFCREFLALLALGVAPAFSQTGQGSIVGTVTDTTGAVIPKVAVRAVHVQTGVVSSTETNQDGLFRLPYVNPGTYDIACEAQGFKKQVRGNIQVRSTETARVEVVLEVGNVAESIEVKASAALLEVETSATGHLVTGEIRNKLPTPQQKIQSILFYMPGVTGQRSEGHAAGQRSRAFVMATDGVSTTEPVRGSISTTTSLYTAEENVAEVKVLTTALPAEYGHSGGGIMNVALKSGTNQLHGIAEERYMSKSMLHRAWEEPSIAAGSFGYHLMTGSLNGPVVLPKIYNGRNRTFFLAGFQRQHSKESFARVGSVPTPGMLAGDFSFGGIGDPIYDPATLTQLPNGSYSRSPFAGNRVPLNRFDPAVRKFLALRPWSEQYDPYGSTFTNRTGVTNNFNFDSHKRSFRTGFDYKIDHSLSDRHKMFGRYSNLRNRADTGDLQAVFANRLFDYNFTPIPTDSHQIVLDDSLTISPATVNEVRIGLNRRKYTRTPESLNQNLAGQYGIPNVGPDTAPNFLDVNGASFFGGRFPEGAQQDVTESFSAQENLTMVRGRHTFKTGYELMRTRANSRINAEPSGRYRFGGTEFPFTPNTGNSFASFLLGSVVRADFTKDFATWLPRWWTNSFYFQDDWKVTPRLTLNLGLRWQYETPFNTKYGQQSQFDPNAMDSLTGLKGALLHPKAPLAGRDLNNFQPRVGLAYNFAAGWVFRGGFAVNTLDLWTNGLQENFEDYLATTVVQPAPGNPDAAFYLSQGPPPIRFNMLADGTSPFVGTNYSGRNVSFYDPAMRSPYILNWNAGVQRQLGSSLVAEVTYQGSAGVGLLNRWDINSIPLNIASTFADLDRVRRESQNFRPYPQFGAIMHYSNYGHNSYHSGTLKVEKRYSHGLTVTSFFTMAKAIDEASGDGAAGGVTLYNRRLEKARSDYDVARRWVTYTTYSLPFGRGRRFLSGGSGLVNKIAGNWNLSLIQTLETGAPFGFTQTGSNNVYLPGTLRPDMAPGKTYGDIQIPWDSHGPCRHSVACALPWADINAFATPNSFTPGQAGRNIVNGPGLFWYQVSPSKEITLRERFKGTLRLDIANPLKRYFFATPNAGVNFRNPQSFGKITASQGSYSGLGGRLYIEAVFKLEF